MLDADRDYVIEEDGVYKVRTCAWSPPGDHPVGCGMFLHVKDGKLVKVEGDPDHPITHGRLCPRCIALDEVVYSEERLRHPMIRAKEDRGRDAWRQVSWDEAYDCIETKVRQIWEDYGAETIFTLTGTGRESTLYAPVYGPAVLNTCNGGSTYAFSGESCYGPRATITNYLLGAGYPEMDWAQYFPDRYDDPRYEVPKYILIWGKDPLYSNPDGFFGHCVIDLMKRGSRLIVVDPRVTWLATRADYHLALRPGTDAAVGLAMLNVIIGEDLYDHEFVEKWCYGFDELSEYVKEFTPEWAEPITWVEADVIREASRAFANNAPSTALWGVALDQSKNSVQAGQAFLGIIAICGYFDVPGGITLQQPTSFIGKWRYEMGSTISEEMAEKHIVDPDGKYKLFNLGAAMGGVQGDTLLNYLEGTLDSFKEVPYKLRMCWMIGTNPLACMADQPKRWYKALLDLDFIVAQDIFMTPSIMGLADVVLPLATFAEHDGIVTPHFGRNQHFVGAINKALDAEDTKSDLEILIDMGKRLRPEIWEGIDSVDDFFNSQMATVYDFNFDDLEDTKSDLEILIDMGKRLRPEIWEGIDSVDDFFNSQMATVYDFNFDDLKNEVAHQLPYEYRKYETGGLRPDGEPGFDTMTGMIELKSVMFPYFEETEFPYYEEPYEYRKYETGGLRPDGEPGFDTMTGMIELKSVMFPYFEETEFPYYEEPEFSPVSQPKEVVDEYPLVYTTGGRNLSMFHSEHRQIPSMRALNPDPMVSINPETAKKYGIEAGDWVAVETMFGRCVQKAKITQMVGPKLVHLEHAWWFPEQDGEAPNLFGVWDANANNLIPHESVGKTGYGAPYKNGICKIYKVESLKG